MPASHTTREDIIAALHRLGLHLPVTVTDVVRAHRVLAKARHPDRFQRPGQKARATEEMKALNHARAFLISHLTDFLAASERIWTRHECVHCCAAYADLWPLDPRD